MELRYYQEEAVRATFDYINKGGKAGLAVLPTASGKSVVNAEIFRRIMTKRPHVRMMMMTHVKELIEQNYEKLKTIWPTAPAGIYSASVGYKQYHSPIIFGGIQSAYRRPEIFGKINMLMIDEAHLVGPKAESMYGQLIGKLREKNPDMVVFGLTATPYRLGMGYLTSGPIFDDIFYDISTLDSFVRLIDEGYLCELIPIAAKNEYDVSNVKKVGGEFSERDLNDKLNLDSITLGVVEETMNHIADRNKGIAFCISIDHATKMAQMFVDKGLRAQVVHGMMKKSERTKIIDAYRTGEINMLTNVGVATTGLDVPDIDYIVQARPTQSTALHVQMLGRGMRVHPSKKDCLVLDFAGNTKRLGPVNDPVVAIPGQKGTGDPPIRICTTGVMKNGAIGCDAINHAAARKCCKCGAEFPDYEIKITATASTESLIKRSDMPKFVEYDVNNVSFSLHTSMSGNEVVKVTFVCGASVFDKYLMLDATKKAYHPSLAFWNKFGTTTQPKTNQEAVDILTSELILPDRIKVWTNKPLPGGTKKIKEVMDVIYDPK